MVRVCALQSRSLNLLAIGPTLAGLGDEDGHTRLDGKRETRIGRTTRRRPHDSPVISTASRRFSGETALSLSFSGDRPLFLRRL